MALPRPHARLRTASAVLSGWVVLAACSSAPLTQPSWPAPGDAMARADAAGLVPTEREYLDTHHHAHLDVLVDGQPVAVPSGIGIDIAAPSGIDNHVTADGSGHEYYVSLCDAPCLSPLHTHDPGGIIHTESQDPNQEPYTLGQFFAEWGVDLNEQCVGEFCTSSTSIAVYLSGEAYEGNPADIELTSHLQIAIIIGTPPASIPAEWTFMDDP